MNRKAPALAVTRLCKAAGITKEISPHSLRRSFFTACLDAGVQLLEMQVAARRSDPRITARYDRARHNHDRHANHTVGVPRGRSLNPRAVLGRFSASRPVRTTVKFRNSTGR